MSTTARKRLIRLDREAKNLCIHCGENPPVAGKRCQNCADRMSATSKRHRDKLIGKNLCTRCGKPSYQRYKICQSCRAKELALKHKAYLEQGLCKSCGKNPIRRPNTTLCQGCMTRIKRNNINRRYKNKLTILNHYGSYCSCCGERRQEFLTLDHVNNDGAEHKREISRCTRKLYIWVIKNNFPSTIRIMCYNCNCVRNTYGYCPHEIERALYIINPNVLLQDLGS